MPRPEPKLKINLQDGNVSIPFTPAAAQALKESINGLMQSLKVLSAKASAAGETQPKPEPQPSLEHQHVGEVFLEVFCNPNIWATPFAAKVLLTIRDDRIRVSTEAELSRLVEDVNEYIEATS
ncbi:hypothetical protein Pse7367_0939 [Thalassoporum mexicanum PCC 7367]|uniref:hypothetical protein n=1 Tax=Thalassoporum mexicanum TaxID=3457544 RepID=UPI00029F8AB8|nr:hypothetical protein [Pseudanabaena sp. PCC 7367]AFY69239.1 hypothetical protein Pse7367_0939 [Pseudanabaena sp. PCC 7367]